VIGGLLVDGPGWRGIFLVNVPLGLAALLGARRLLPESRAEGPTTAPRSTSAAPRSSASPPAC
jgi:predicted MFS family arabinose efflux permease